jgi:hypothetical protein
MSIIDGGGPVVERAKAVLLFRGPGWNNGLPAATADVVKMYSAVLASPYVSRLVQYRGIRRPTLVDNSTDASDIGHLGPDPRGFLTTQVLLIRHKRDRSSRQERQEERTTRANC